MVSSAVGLIFMSSSLSAYAAELSPHQYAIERAQVGPYYGAYLDNSLGQDDLTQNDNSSYNPFIDKELWFCFDAAGTKWIEVGDTVGLISGLNRSGHFWAENYVDSTGTQAYRETLIDPADPVPTGDHNFTVGSGASGAWNVSVDNVTKAVISDFSNDTSADHVDVGLETSSDQTSFRSGTISYNLQYQDSTATWLYLDNFAAFNSNSLGWVATFNSPTNTTYANPTVVFTHS